MHIRRLLVVASSLLFVTLAACEDDNELADQITAFNRDYCQIQQGYCCTQQGKTFDGGACELLFAIAASNTFDKAAADSCIASLRAAQSSPTFCTDNGGAEVTAKCNGVYKKTSGTVAAGGKCESDGDCVTVPNAETECIYVSAGTGGSTSSGEPALSRLCQTRQRGTDGSPCAGDRRKDQTSTVIVSTEPQVTVCWEEDGFYCKKDTQQCARIAAPGEPCAFVDNLACDATSFCGRENADAEYRCLARRKVGEDCDSSSRACEDGTSCSYLSSKCVANVPPGGACDNRELLCDAKSFCSNGKCETSGLAGGLFCK